MTDETKILGRCEFMKYNNDELKIINEWLTSLAVQHLVDEDFFEYKDGQLLEFAKAKEGSLLTWDEWQHLQIMMDMEIPLKMAIRFVDILWENDIEVLEMNTTKSKEYEEKCNKIYACSKTSKTIDLRTEDACCSVALYNIIDDFHLDNVPFYVYDFTEYCKKFVAIKKIESAAKGAAAKLLNDLTGTVSVPIILEAGYLHYGDYEVFSSNPDAQDIVPDLVKYYESLGFKNVNTDIGHYEESVVMLYDKTNLFSEEPKNIFI